LAAVSALPKIHRFFVKLTHYTYSCDGLTNFGNKAHEITGNGNRLIKYLLAAFSALPKIHRFFVKLTHYTYSYDSLTNFGIKAHEITGNGNRLKKYFMAQSVQCFAENT
jgi:hypothetical protein